MNEKIIILIAIGVAMFVIGALGGYIKERKAMKYANVQNSRPEHKEYEFMKKKEEEKKEEEK